MTFHHLKPNDMKEIKFNRAGFNAEKVAAQTEAEFVKKNIGKIWPSKAVKHQEADLKEVYKLCTKAVGKKVDLKTDVKPESKTDKKQVGG